LEDRLKGEEKKKKKKAVACFFFPSPSRPGRGRGRRRKRKEEVPCDARGVQSRGKKEKSGGKEGEKKRGPLRFSLIPCGRTRREGKGKGKKEGGEKNSLLPSAAISKTYQYSSFIAYGR